MKSATGTDSDEEELRFLPLWSRAFKRAVKAGFVPDTKQAEDIFLLGWTSGEHNAFDQVAERFGRFVRGYQVDR